MNRKLNIYFSVLQQDKRKYGRFKCLKILKIYSACYRKKTEKLNIFSCHVEKSNIFSFYRNNSTKVQF